MLTKDEWKMLADKCDRERTSGKHTWDTNDILSALRDIALSMWADIPEPSAGPLVTRGMSENGIG